MARNQTIPSVCVIIPNKNGLNHLVYSLPLLMRTGYKNFYCILVDNNSTDGSIGFVRNNFKSIEILENKDTRGFASTVNKGIKQALIQNSDYVAVFNSDIKVLPQWIDTVINLFEIEDNVGLIGYTEVAKENKDFFVDNQKIGLSYQNVKRLPGCLYLCPTQVFRNIGLFDEKYYMYGEDNDFFSRLTHAGYLILQTNIPVWHYGEGSSQSYEFRNSWLVYRNAIRCSIKNESIILVVRMFCAMLYLGCNPFLKNPTNDLSLKRLRRYNCFINFVFFVASIGWNIVNIIPTLQSRYEVRQNIKKMKIDVSMNK
ncbi:MAG: glycosyltransferase [Candidatus Omnitrophota bacterium]|jgi:hypothetical protein